MHCSANETAIAQKEFNFLFLPLLLHGGFYGTVKLFDLHEISTSLHTFNQHKEELSLKFYPIAFELSYLLLLAVKTICHILVHYVGKLTEVLSRSVVKL